jgi:hypothetical protein
MLQVAATKVESAIRRAPAVTFFMGRSSGMKPGHDITVGI